MTNATVLLTLMMLNTTVWDNTTEQTITQQINSLKKSTMTGEIIFLIVFIMVIICLCLKDWDTEDCEQCCYGEDVQKCCYGEESTENNVEHDIRYYTVV